MLKYDTISLINETFLVAKMNMRITSEKSLELAGLNDHTRYNLSVDLVEDPVLDIAKDIRSNKFTINHQDIKTSSKFAKLYSAAIAFVNDEKNAQKRDTFESELQQALKELKVSTENEYLDFMAYYSSLPIDAAKNTTHLIGGGNVENIKVDLARKKGAIYFETTAKNSSFSGEIKTSVRFAGNRWNLERVEATGECAEQLEKVMLQKQLAKINQLKSKNPKELDNHLEKSLFLEYQSKSKEEFQEIIKPVFGEKNAKWLTQKFEAYQNKLHQNIENNVVKYGVKGAFERNDNRAIKNDTFLNHVVNSLHSLKNKLFNQQPQDSAKNDDVFKTSTQKEQDAIKEKNDPYRVFLQELSEKIKETEWSVGFLGLGGKKYDDGKKYPDHIHEIISKIDGNFHTTAGWKELFDDVQKISANAAEKQSFFRSEQTQNTYDSLKKGLEEVRQQAEPQVAPQNPDNKLEP